MQPETTRTSSVPSPDEIGVAETSDNATAIGYIRVSTREQADSGAGLEAQRRAITLACRARGWDLAQIFEDLGASGKNLKRPGLLAALDAVDLGEAQILVIAKLDRLSRSLIDFSTLMERARKRGWHLAALDLGVDTSSPSGEMMANVLAAFAQYERRLIGVRTAEGLAIKRAQGIRLGRPPEVDREVAQRIKDLRASGLSFRTLAALLESEGVAAPRGGTRWHASTLQRITGSA